jgi:hypothetical protein
VASTGPRRNERQRTRDRYARAREDAERLGLIHVSPEGSLRPERVDPASQESPALPALDRLAVRRGWAVPDAFKPTLIDELLRVVLDPDSTPLERIASFRALFTADQRQWERDRVELANKVSDGGQTKVAVTYEQAIALIQEVERQIGRPIMPPAMAEIQTVADQVLPPEIM